MYLDGVPQVRDERRIDSLHDLRCDLVPVDPVEQADPLAEEDRRQRDGELIDQTRVEVLDDGVGTSRDSDILASGDLTRLPQRALDPVVDEVERGPARALPGTANLVGQDEDRRVERSFLGPETFSSLEHPLPHDVHAGTVESLLQDAVVLAGLTTFAKLEVLAEEPLLGDPLLEFHPLAEPVLVVRVVGVGKIHPFGSHEAVERHSHAKEHFALLYLRRFVDVVALTIHFRSSSPSFSRSSRIPASRPSGSPAPSKNAPCSVQTIRVPSPDGVISTVARETEMRWSPTVIEYANTMRRSGTMSW